MKKIIFLLFLFLFFIVFLAFNAKADTFGNTNGYYSYGASTDVMYGYPGIPTNSGKLDNVTLKLSWSEGTAAKCALYKTSDWSLIAETEERSSGGNGIGWYVFNFTGREDIVGGTEYCPFIWVSDNTGLSVSYYYGSGYGKKEDDYNYNGFPNLISPDNYSGKYSIYVCYTPTQWNDEISFNGSIYNISVYRDLSTWNGSVCNTSINWIDLISFNGSIFNYTIYQDVSTWNGSFWNITTYTNIQTLNGSFYNKTLWNNLYNWNGSIFNTTSYRNIINYNGSIFNTSNWIKVSNYNGTIYNLTDIRINCSIDGVNVCCSYEGNILLDSYMWNASGGSTGWVTETSHCWTFEEDKFIDIVFSGNLSGTIINVIKHLKIDIEGGDIFDEDNPDEYTDSISCENAGFHWWDSKCHNYTRPHPWNDDRDYEDAGKHNIIIEIASQPIFILAFIFLVLIAIIWWRRRNKYE